MSADQQSPCSSPKIGPSSEQSHKRSISKNQSRGSLYIDDDDDAISNVVRMVCFATALMENLARINRGKLLVLFERISLAREQETKNPICIMLARRLPFS